MLINWFVAGFHEHRNAIYSASSLLLGFLHLETPLQSTRLSPTEYENSNPWSNFLGDPLFLLLVMNIPVFSLISNAHLA